MVEGMDGDAEASGVSGAGLAAGGEFLREIEELLTGAAGAFHPYTSANGGGRGKAGVSRSDTFDGLSCGAGWNLGTSECAVFLFGIEQGSGSIAVAAVGMWKSGLWAISTGGEKRVKTWFWFLAFHRPSSPWPTSGPSTLTRPSLSTFDRRFYPRQAAKNQNIPGGSAAASPPCAGSSSG